MSVPPQYDAKKCHEIASRTSKGGRSAKRKIYLPDLPMDSSSISPSILAVGRFFQILPDSSRFFQILPDSSRFFQYFTKSVPCRYSELVYSELHILP